jgi:uncharacterized protein (UPF0248 family)
MVFNILNKLKWSSRLGECELVITHRGASGDKMRISGYDITEVKRGNFCYTNEKDEEVYIPNHRVLEIFVNNKLAWKKRTI